MTEKMYCVEQLSNLDIIKYFITEGVNINEQSNNSENVVDIAVWFRNVEIVEDVRNEYKRK